MPSLEIILTQVVPFVLVTFRLLGLFMFAPVINSLSIPTWPRVLIAVMAATALYPMVPRAFIPATALTLWGLAPLVLSEMLAGAVMGLIASLPILCMQSTGFLIGHQMGLNLVASYSPDEASSDAIGQMLVTVATAGFIVAGGLESLFIGLAETFSRVPAGGLGVPDVPLSAFIDLVTAAGELSMRLALPVVGTLFLVLLVLGVLSRAIPQLNLMTIGFTFKILAGLAMLTWSIFTIAEVSGEEVVHAVNAALDWGRSLGRGGG